MIRQDISSTHSDMPSLSAMQRIRTVATNRRTQISWLTLAITIMANSLFAAIYAEGRTPVFVACCWLLATLCTGFVITYRPKDTLTAVKIASLLYSASFAYGPLWLADKGNYRLPYFGSDVEQLMGTAAFLTLLGYIFFLIGYFVSLHLRFGQNIRRQPRPFSMSARQRRYALICAMVITVLGGVCYLQLLLGAGGVWQLLNNHSQGRADMFYGIYGGWFWGMHLLFAAFGLFAIVTMPKHPWLCLSFAMLLAAAFVPFQGRDIVVAPVFCWLVLFHLLRRPVRWRMVFLGGFILLLLSAIVGAFRTNGDSKASEENLTFFSTFIDNIDRHLTNVVSMNIEQLDSVMIAVRYVENEGNTIGPMVLMSWAEPLDRAFLGDIIPSIYTGVFMDRLIIPEHKGWNTALSPSLPGELYIGLGWFGVICGMLGYGILFGRLFLWHQGCNSRPILLAAYPFVIYMVAKMIVDGSTHAFRPIVVTLTVLACALLAPPNKISSIKSGEALG